MGRFHLDVERIIGLERGSESPGNTQVTQINGDFKLLAGLKQVVAVIIAYGRFCPFDIVLVIMGGGEADHALVGGAGSAIALSQVDRIAGNSIFHRELDGAQLRRSRCYQPGL